MRNITSKVIGYIILFIKREQYELIKYIEVWVKMFDSKNYLVPFETGWMIVLGI